MNQTNSPVSRRDKAPLGLIGLGAALLFGLTLIVVVNLHQTQGWIHHAQSVVTTLTDLRATLQDLENAQRGYLLTRRDSYLQPFAPGAERLSRHLAELQGLFPARSQQAVEFAVLESKARAKVAEMESTIELGRSGRYDLALAVVDTNEGRRSMEDVSQVISRLREQESGLLTGRLHRLYSYFYALVGLLLVYAALIGTALWELRRKIEETSSARAALQTAYDDLDEKVRLRTADLSQKTEELARSNEELGRFAYMASHDLQEPLRKIALMTDLLSRPETPQRPGARERFIAAIQQDANRMRDLIVGMLNLSRIGAKAVPFDRVETSKVVQNALRDLALSVKEARAEFSFGDLPPVWANDTQLHQLFLNLIGNALKFRDHKAVRIEVGAVRQNERWLFHVRDNGIGFEQAYADRIFRAFERLHGKDSYAGSGLGLAICKKIVETSGGRIWVESAPGQGTTFYFTLPAEAPVGAGVPA